MKFSTFVLTAFIAALTPTMCNAASIKGSTVEVGAWTVDAYANDDTGAFSHCVAAVPFRSGILLVFSIQSGANSWQLGLANPQWKLPIGQKYPITYKIDRGVPLMDTATVLAPTLIALDLPANSVLFRLFKAGHLLVVNAAGGNFYFDLKGSARALQVALSCTRHYESNPAEVAANRENPFAGSTGSISAASSDLKTEATTVLANILGAAGIQGFRLVSDVPSVMQDYQAAWSAPGVVGGIKIQQDATISDAVTILIASDERGCKGTFASYRERAEQGLVSIRTACKQETGDGINVTYMLAPRNAGGVYQFFALAMPEENPDAMPEGDAVATTAGRMFDASLRTLGR
jgi:hypothetical protein